MHIIDRMAVSSSKHRHCPVCKSTVKRQGVRIGGERFNVIHHHLLRGVQCDGSNMPWGEATGRALRVRVGITEVSDGIL